VIREVSAQPEKARQFFIAWADRILLGSDLVVQRNIHPTYYTSRFHVQRQMWETDYRGQSMIRDPDADGEPILHGLGCRRTCCAASTGSTPSACTSRLERALTGAGSLLWPGKRAGAEHRAIA